MSKQARSAYRRPASRATVRTTLTVRELDAERRDASMVSVSVTR